MTLGPYREGEGTPPESPVLTEREYLNDPAHALRLAEDTGRPVRVDVDGGRARVWIVRQTEDLDL